LCGPWAVALADGHRSLMTPERVLNEYNEDLIFFLLALLNGLDWELAAMSGNDARCHVRQ